jgi:hypothetical protein
MTRRTATSFAISSLTRLSQSSKNTKSCTNAANAVNRSTKLFFSTAPSTSNTSNYQSPYAEYFTTIKNNQTTLTGKSSSNTNTTTKTAMLKCGIPESTLKFKTTSYGRLMLPPYVQTGEYKVTLQVKVRDLPFHTELEHQIFQQIVGTRFNPEKNDLKLTCDHFASRIENKRHLCNMLDRIVIGAKRLAKEIDVDVHVESNKQQNLED